MDDHQLNKREFWNWMTEEFYSRFPQMLSWHESLPEENKKSVRLKWFLQLRKWTTEQLTEVIGEFFDGEKTPPDWYDRDRWPAFLQLELKRIEASRIRVVRMFADTVDEDVCEICHGTGIVTDDNDAPQPSGHICDCRQQRSYG